MPTLSASQLEGSKPQLVAGLVAGTTNEYAVLKVNADGSITAGGAQLLFTAYHSNPSAFTMPNGASTFYAFPSVSGSSSSIYNTSTGEFTIPSTGTYAILTQIYYTVGEDSTLTYVNFTYMLNGIESGSCPLITNGFDGYTSNAVLFYNFSAGNVIRLKSFVSCAPNGLTLNTGLTGPIYNQFQLFKL